MKKIIGVLFFVLTGIAAFAQASVQHVSEESWRILKKAQQEFDLNNYSMAMQLVQEAVSARKKEVLQTSSILESALTPYQVRKAGDRIDDVLEVLSERQEYKAYSIIADIVESKGADFFNGSISNLTEYVKKRAEYPEAYFLIAKIYKLEGEFSFALDYLERARANAGMLEIPAQQIDILYEMADVAEFLNDTVTQEKALLLIANNDGQFNNVTLKNSLLRTSKSVKEDNSSKLFSLFRIDAISTMSAYFSLSSIYFAHKKYQDSYLTNLYGVLIAFTHINSILEERDSDYAYDTLESFFEECALYPDILKWCNGIGFWRGFYNIYELGMLNKFERFPRDILRVLAEHCPEPYWKKVAEESYSSVTENQ